MRWLIELLKHSGRQLLRNFYWLYLLNKARIGSNTKIGFPIVLEGRGKIAIGEGSKIEKQVNIGVSADSQLSFGKNVEIKERFYIRVGGKAHVNFGNGCRLGRFTEIYTNSNWKIGDQVQIASYCALFAREPGVNGRFELGNGTHIGDYTIIDLVDDVIIGEEVAIGPRCTLYTHDHGYGEREKPAWKGELIKKPIIVGKGAWIGSNVTILPGVTIGEKAVVAAGSIVTKDVEPFTLVGGIPAKKMKDIILTDD